jgi:hypothetical protein
MGLFGEAKPKRIVAKQYGRDSFLGLANPIAAFFLLGGQGMKGQLRSQARVVESMEKDAVSMAKQGYRIVSTLEYERPALGIRYLKVTYELVDPPAD